MRRQRNMCEIAPFLQSKAMRSRAVQNLAEQGALLIPL
jgi:1,2-phenylacetyl-CoA epoxidase catalytic subunit